jgi:Holliday junction resolvase RusA-like endonuclease
MQKVLVLSMPYQKNLSLNYCYKHTKYGVYLSKSAKMFRENIFYMAYNKEKFQNEPVRVEIHFTPPNNRKYDVDNPAKIILDALQYAKVIENDSQVMQLYLEKHPPNVKSELKIVVSSLANLS